MSLLWTILGRVPGVETKVTAAGLGALIGGALIWALSNWVFNGTVPGSVAGIVDWLAPILGAVVFGWIAPHTHRPDLQPAPQPIVTTPPPP